MFIFITRTNDNTSVFIEQMQTEEMVSTMDFPVDQYEFSLSNNRYGFYPITGQLGSTSTTSKQPKASFPAEHTIVYDNRTFNDNVDPN